MTIVKCENGHYFDADEGKTCPSCSAKSSPPASKREKHRKIKKYAIEDDAPTQPMSAKEEQALLRRLRS